MTAITLRTTVQSETIHSCPKPLEKIVLLQLLACLNFHDLLCLSQSAYRPCHSTDTALLTVTKRILLVLGGGVVSVLTLLDLSSAFDTVDRRILFQTLQFLYGISCTVLLWLESYSKDTYCDCRVHDLRTFPLVSHRVQFWVVASSLLCLHLSPL